MQALSAGHILETLPLSVLSVNVLTRKQCDTLNLTAPPLISFQPVIHDSTEVLAMQYVVM